MIARGPIRSVALLCLAVGVALVPCPAAAKSHLWKLKEFFSNADGSVQYIEMDVLDPAGTGEWVTQGVQLASRSQAYTLPVNLPQQNTYLRSMLFATPAFAALPGAPTPDFVIPARFFDPAGDELRYRFTLDVFSFASGELPTDGHRALRRSDRASVLNTPQNFAGATATIDASSGTAVGGLWPPLLGVVVASALVLHATMRRGERRS